MAIYGGAHKKLRAKYQKRMDAGEVFNCWRCGKVIGLSEPWDLGHAQEGGDPTEYAGPECVGCNRATSRRRAANVVDTSREW
jgi:hypothetical protein